MAQTHRDTAEITVIELLPYLLRLAGEEFYGETTFKWRHGRIVGHVHEDRDHLVTGLPGASPDKILEALKGVTLGTT